MTAKHSTHVPVSVDLSNLTHDQGRQVAALLQVVGLIDNVYSLQKADLPFYPTAISKEEIARWAEKHPERETDLRSHFTNIRRLSNGELFIEPYCDDFKPELRDAALIMRRVADWIKNSESATEAEKAFADFLLARGQSFLNNNYHPSEQLWIRLDGGAPFELTIGPYEEYEDGVLGVKRTFEATLGIVLQEETAAIQQYKAWVRQYDTALAEKYGYSVNHDYRSAIMIDLIASGGHCKQTYVPVAYVLPNDEDFRLQHGSKIVFIRNILQTRFDTMLEPIHRTLLGQSHGPLKMDDYQLFVVAHELTHSLGVSFMNPTFEESGPMLEELKADVLGICFIRYGEEEGFFPQGTAYNVMVTRIYDMIRQMRDDPDEAHGLSAVIQMNWLQEHEAVWVQNARIEFGPPTRLYNAFESLGNVLIELALDQGVWMARNFIRRFNGLPAGIDHLIDAINRSETPIPHRIKPEIARV